jgi:conjugation system TraG family ATPase
MVMEKQLDELLPVWAADADGILSVTGAYTIGFEVLKPEIFTLAAADYEQLHGTILKALRVLPKGTVLHFQDWYERRRYEAPEKEGRSFLEAASDRHFAGRPWLEHRAYLFISKIPAGRRKSSSVASRLLRRRLVPEELLDPAAMRVFADTVSQFAAIAGSGKVWSLRCLGPNDLWSKGREPGLLERYCYLSGQGDGAIRDISFTDGIRIGGRHCQLFTLAEAARLPAYCAAGIRHDQYSTEGSPFVMAYSSPLGLLLDCNHIYNQYIFTGDAEATLRELEAKRLRLESLSKASRGNAMARDAVNDFLNEAVREQRMAVKAHFNVLAWSDEPAEWREIKNKVGRAMMQVDVYPHEETVGAPQIWWAGIPGNAGDFPMNETFDCFAEQALCLVNLESNARSTDDARTIRFGDRLTGRPVELDIFHGPMERSVIQNRGMFVCASSGAGKSMLCNHIFRSQYDQGAHIVIVDIGGSYRGLCELVGGVYYTYTKERPICLNPFHIRKGDMPGEEKKESLKALLITLWKEEHENFNRSEYVALSNALQGYYNKWQANGELVLGFDSFYDYLQTDYRQALETHGVSERYFDMENFLYVLRPFYRGGEFDYLLNASTNLDIVDKRLVIFELDNIKDHILLLPILSLILMELVLTKMQLIPDVLKVFAIEEAWKQMMKAGMSQFMRFAWKAFRKLYGAPIAVTQELDDLVSSPIIKEAIIGNSDIKIMLDMRKWLNKFDPLQATLGMDNHGKTMLFSVNRANEPGRRYREFYLELGNQERHVLRFEPSPEEYYAYTTEPKEKLLVLEYAERYGSMEKGITALVAERMRDN